MPLSVPAGVSAHLKWAPEGQNTELLKLRPARAQIQTKSAKVGDGRPARSRAPGGPSPLAVGVPPLPGSGGAAPSIALTPAVV